MIQRYSDILQEVKKLPIKPIPESAVVSACIDALFKLGCYVWRNNTGAWKPANSKRPIYYGKKGSGDILGVTPTGRFLSVECKSGANKQRDSQLEFQQRVEEKNGLYILAYSVDDLIARKNEIVGIV